MLGCGRMVAGMDARVRLGQDRSSIPCLFDDNADVAPGALWNNLTPADHTCKE